MPIYAREKVSRLWVVDPIEHTLEIFWLEGERWSVVGVWNDAARVRAEPFEAIELEVLWAT